MMLGRDREREGDKEDKGDEQGSRQDDMGPCFIFVSPNPPPVEDRVG